MKNCISCGEQIEGRIDKIFCTSYCKSNYHYKKNKEKNESLFKKIDTHLKVNRRLLNHFNKAGKSVIRKEKLLTAGFNPKYFTHYWKNTSGDVYLFCYEYGFLERKEHGRTKYILVKWQSYMDK